MSVFNFTPFLSFSLWFSYLSFVNSKASIKILQPLPPITEGDIGSRLTLQCNISGHPIPQFFWYKDGHQLTKDLSLQVKGHGGSLYSSGLHRGDEGSYTCVADNSYEFQKLTTKLIVKTCPGQLVNVTVIPSTVVATVRWYVGDDGGYPISHFTLVYFPLFHQANDTKHFLVPVKISPTVREFLVYHLKPDTHYVFRIWASNKLGQGKPITVKVKTAKPLDLPEVVQHRIAHEDYFSSTLWMVAASMVAATVLFVSCLSCVLIYRDGRHIYDEIELQAVPNLIPNRGFDIDLEESRLLREADQNGNIEQIVTTNNNSIVQPIAV